MNFILKSSKIYANEIVKHVYEVDKLLKTQKVSYLPSLLHRVTKILIRFDLNTNFV